MTIENNKITFEFDEKEIKQFELACSILDINPEEQLKVFINRIIDRALRAKPGSHSEEAAADTEEMILRRIRYWSEKIFTSCHQVIGSYLIEVDETNQNEVSIERLQKITDEYFQSEARFAACLRSLCSLSTHAYGQIFDYNKGTRCVTLSDKYKAEILSLKDKFIILR